MISNNRIITKMMTLWVWMFTMSVEGIYYGCRDTNDVHAFHGFIIREHNPQDRSQ